MPSNTPPVGDRRKSIGGLFIRSPGHTSPGTSNNASTPKPVKRKPTASRISTAFSPASNSPNLSDTANPTLGTPSSTPSNSRPVSMDPSASPIGSDSPRSSRPSLSKRTRPSSIFGSLRSLRYGEEEDTPPLTATSASSRSQSFMWKEFGGELVDIGKSRTILHHGEAQTSSGWFWKKKEYLVLTESHLIRYKSRSKANEAFPAIPSVPTRNDLLRHSSSQSIDSIPDQQSFNSDVSGEKVAGIPLEWIVAVFLPDESRVVHTLEVSYLDVENAQSASITLSFTESDERDVWLKALSKAANSARLVDPDPVPMKLAEYISRVVERDHDYDPENIKIYKVVKRLGSKNSGRSSADESVKISPTVLFLTIGINKIHIIPLPKATQRSSASALNELADGGSFGILTLTWMSIASHDDSFSLAFRFPFQPPKSFSLASLAATEIALQLRLRDSYLRPLWIQQPFAFSIPSPEENVLLPEPDHFSEDLNCFDRTLTAFCVAYGVNPYNIRYSVNESGDDSPLFDLLPPTGRDKNHYSALEILAVLRSLRYNEHFRSISFSKVNLDVLHRLRDGHGLEYICGRTKTGAAIQVPIEEQEAASLLTNEIRAIAISSRTLRRLYCAYSMPSLRRSRSKPTTLPSGCEILEALYPICRDQNTNIDWICLNGIPLTSNDLDYLISMAAYRTCHLRAIEVSDCSLREDGISLLLDSLKAQSETLESVDISRNPAKLTPSILVSLMEPFSYISKLDLSGTVLNSSSEPFLPFEVLSKWRLGTLRLSGLVLNEESISVLCKYVACSKAHYLSQLSLANCSLGGKHVSDLMRHLTIEPGTARLLHLDVSQNNLQQGHSELARAFATNLSPTHLSMKSIEYDDDHVFAEYVLGLAKNKSIRSLDISEMSLPGQASPETCTALEELFSRNNTLEDLDISGENSRIEVTKLGTGFIQALRGLRRNKTLQCLKIQHQKLGLQGASALADIIRENDSLQYLHCDFNGITLTGFTDLVNALAFNRSILYLSSLEDGRNEALHQTAAQIKLARERANDNASLAPTRMSGVRRTIAKIGSGETASGRTAPVPRWSDQDVQAALRLVDEGWEEQVIRLRAFLDRNNKLASGIVLEGSEDLSDEELQRHHTVESLSKVMERVRVDSTPTVEKYVELGALETTAAPLERFPQEQQLSMNSLSPAAAAPSPPNTSSGNTLADVEIDTTPMFEKGDPFALSVPLNEDPRPPTAMYASHKAKDLSETPATYEDTFYKVPPMELKLPGPKAKR